MLKTKNIIVGILLVILGYQHAFAASYVRMAAMHMSEEVGADGTTEKASRTLLDFGGGYVSKSWTVGFLYGTERYERAGFESNRTAIGPTIGWITRKEQGPYILGTYMLSLNMSPGSYQGNGTQFDIGYKFLVEKISFAAQLSQKNFRYKENDGRPAYTDNKLDPYFVVWLDF